MSTREARSIGEFLTSLQPPTPVES